jgi:hypothetical protein
VLSAAITGIVTVAPVGDKPVTVIAPFSENPDPAKFAPKFAAINVSRFVPVIVYTMLVVPPVDAIAVPVVGLFMATPVAIQLGPKPACDIAAGVDEPATSELWANTRLAVRVAEVVLGDAFRFVTVTVAPVGD